MTEFESILLWVVGGILVLLLFIWILQIEPYVRRRTRTSTLFVLPWAPWKDYYDGMRLTHRYPRTPWFFGLFRWLTYLGIVGMLLWVVLRIAT